MSSTESFGRNGEMPKPKGKFWRLNFGFIVLYLAIAGTIAASEIGEFLIVVSAISVIGFPISLFIMALPTVFIVAFTTWVLSKILSRFGIDSLIVSGVFAVGLLAGYPQVHNFFMKSRVDGLIENDRAQAINGIKPGFSGKTFGVLSNGRRHKCNNLCQRVLLESGANTFLIAGMGKNKIDPDFKRTGTAYSLVKRDRCTQEEETQNLKKLLYTNKDVEAELGMRAKLENGYCFVVDKAPISSADVVLFRISRWGKSAYSTSFNPFKQLIQARRMGYYKKGADSEFELALQKTFVDYSLLGPFIAVEYRGGGGLRIRSDLWRTRHRNYDRDIDKYDEIDFLSNKVGMSVSLPGDDQN